MSADLVMTNGRIYTVDAQQPWAQAVACRDGRILAVGSDDEVLALASADSERLDVGGRLVLPGFTDAHIHFLQYAIRQQQIDLFGVGFDVLVARLETAVSQAEPGEWVLGWGWDENLWPDVQPHKSLLDRMAPDTPVALARMDMHTWWVNSAALNRAGVTRETPNPPESALERDADGDLTGILREWNAIELVEQHVPQPQQESLLAWMQDAIRDMHRVGITAVHDQRVEREGPDSFRLWQMLRQQGNLRLRVHMHIAADFLPQAAILGLCPGFGDDRLWVGHVKAFADGSMGSRTASMLAPFENESDNVGVIVTPTEELWQLAVRAGEAGFPLSVHAIGDRAVREVLNVMHEHRSLSSAQQVTLPHRVEHVQLLHPDDVVRLGHPQIVASVQPVHLRTDWATADRVWGERARYAYAFRSLLEQGALLAFGSDAPVAPINPMLGIHAAVTRRDERGRPAGGWYADERLNVPEAIYGYTMAPAIVAGKQAVQGSITPGKWADMIVLSRDLFAVPPEMILETEVDVTVFAREIVYHR